jgi:hypothetical protein
MSPTVSKQVQLTIEGTTVPSIIIVTSHYSWTRYCLIIIEPDIVVQIASTAAEGSYLTTGTNFSLICIVNGTAKLRSDLTFEWMHFNGTDHDIIEKVRANSRELHFEPLKLSDAGEYTCTVNISSSLLNSNLIINSVLAYTILITGKLICQKKAVLYIFCSSNHRTSAYCDCYSINATNISWVIS